MSIRYRPIALAFVLFLLVAACGQAGPTTTDVPLPSPSPVPPTATISLEPAAVVSTATDRPAATETPLPTDMPTTTIAAQDTSRPQTRPADGAVMVYVPGGTFQMGSSKAQIDGALALCKQYPDDYGKCRITHFEV
ncbi:MAG: hypothetical protein PVF77_07945, partial [Anaerolineae bacterium]